MTIIVSDITSPFPIPGAGVTRADLLTQVRARLGETTEDFWKDTDIYYALNEAVTKFSNEEKWDWYLTATSGDVAANDGYMELTGDVPLSRHGNLFIYPDGAISAYECTRVTPTVGFRLRAGLYGTRGPNTTRPAWYYLQMVESRISEGWVTTVEFVPQNSVALVVEYQYNRLPISMEGAEDVCDVPPEYVEAIIARATGNCWLKELHGQDKAEEQFRIYGDILDQAVDEKRTQAPGDILVMGKEEPQLPSGTPSETVSYQIPEYLGSPGNL